MNTNNNFVEYLNLENAIKLVLLVIVIFLVNFGYSKFTAKKPIDQIKFVQIDLVKISGDYMQKSIMLVANVNENNQLTADQKMAKAQNIMKIVGNSIDAIVNEYSKTNKVVVLQKQMIASDAGFPIPDITLEVENQIDTRINPDDLHNAVAK